LLAGSGNQVRHIRLENARALDRPEAPARTIVRAISSNRRPRR
jgi:hypothetical protein